MQFPCGQVCNSCAPLQDGSGAFSCQYVFISVSKNSANVFRQTTVRGMVLSDRKEMFEHPTSR